MGMPLSHYLKDFSAPPPQQAPGIDFTFGDANADDPFQMDFQGLPEPDPVDVEAEKQQAYAEGYRAAEEAMREAFEVERQALETAHAAAVAQLETRLRQEAGSLFGEQFDTLGRTISLGVSQHVAEALAPFFEEQVAAKAVSDLAELISGTLAAGEATIITVRGPAGLFEMLCEHLPEQASALRHIEAVDLDLQAEINDAVLVTRLSAFVASLKKVLG
ncbi:GTPase [Peteryoungia desertarenae]|uniref:GTPase n=1 Tax=Peteryoungia desertarenae TaxID=1813451 RepID=A0ABX6QLE5_9HYPH|nr:GTPase [Peteryoungia desertarenae]QLF69373.1 GTPase [Peteryoungia desertarenae]